MNPKGNCPELGQFFTPAWAAEALTEMFFGDLSSRDVLLEPSCGQGAFLNAVPRDVFAFGVEIDEKLAALARENTGREVVCGDFRTVPLPYQPTAIVGNPPFSAAVFDGFLDRAQQVLPEGGRAGFIAPAHFFSFSSRVEEWSRRWSIVQQGLPRDLFPRISFPLVFANLTKDRRRQLVGFALFNECAAMKSASRASMTVLAACPRRRSVWAELVDRALGACGGEAASETLYEIILPKAPKGNSFPKDKIRQTLQAGRDAGRYVHLGIGRWALNQQQAFALA